jgi:hypothetical protein
MIVSSNTTAKQQLEHKYERRKKGSGADAVLLCHVRGGYHRLQPGGPLDHRPQVRRLWVGQPPQM